MTSEEKEIKQASKDMQVPATLGKQEVAVLKEAMKKTTVEMIEDDTAEFIKSVFSNVKFGAEQQQKWFDELWARKDELSPAQLIALVSNMTINQNDATSKALAPTAQLITAKQQAETAKAQAMAAAGVAIASNNADMKNLAQNTDREVLIGLTQLAHVMAALKPQQEDNGQTPQE